MAKPDPRSGAEEARKERHIPAVSAVLGDGTILETVVDREAKRTSFVLAKDGEWQSADSVPIDSSARLVPYSPRNNLLAHEVVLLPSKPEEYGSEDALLPEIESFIHRYVDVNPLFEKIGSYYVLLTWIYDRFNELPYLRLRGEPGSGKTRFMLTVGSLCYKPIFASGASTVSPLFRTPQRGDREPWRVQSARLRGLRSQADRDARLLQGPGAGKPLPYRGDR